MCSRRLPPAMNSVTMDQTVPVSEQPMYCNVYGETHSTSADISAANSYISERFSNAGNCLIATLTP